MILAFYFTFYSQSFDLFIFQIALRIVHLLDRIHEGLVVDKNITMADLKGTLDLVMKKMFGQDRELRWRPSYFPFTEPSVEVDISCFKCGGKPMSL